MRKRSALRGAALATGLALTLCISACGSSTSTKSGGPTKSGGVSKSAGGAPSAAALGTPKAATGAAVKVGYVDEGQTAAFDTTNEENGARAVVQYANDYLGGLAGHKIELDICQAKGTPSGAQACGNQFVRDKDVVVGAAAPGEPDQVIAQIGPAGIPFAANQLGSQSALQAKNVFSLSNPLAVFGTPAQYAKDNGVKRAALVVIDLPNSAGATKQIAPLVFGNAGVAVDPVLIPPGTADMTPQIQTELGKKPGEFFVIGDPNFCSTAAKAFQTLAVSSPLLYVSNCLNANAGTALPGLDKAKFASTYSDDPSAADTKLVKAIFAKYGNVKLDASSLAGSQDVLGIVRLVNAASPNSVTAATVSTALKTAPAVDYPLGAGIKLQCNGPISLSADICSTAGLLAGANSDGTLKDAMVIDAAALYKLPGAK